MRRRGLAGVLAFALLWPAAGVFATPTTLLNVSYDPTRELYRDVDRAFATQWKAAHGESVTVNASHGGSAAQARAVLDGLQADVVTLGIASDIDVLARNGLVDKNWQQALPNHAVPYTSTVVFLVRKGNPKRILNWTDLVRDGVAVITPNPKTSSGGRWSYIAAYLWALHREGGSDQSARAFLAQLYRHVPILDTGARGATNTFVQRGQGDVLLAWENEALLASRDLGAGKFDIVYPRVSVKAEAPVAVVSVVATKRGTTALAEAYLHFLFTPEGQRIAARHYFRPIDSDVAATVRDRFPSLETYDVAGLGGWSVVQPRHFNDGGVFDQIYKPGQ